jgi:hypothetical protein
MLAAHFMGNPAGRGVVQAAMRREAGDATCSGASTRHGPNRAEPGVLRGWQGWCTGYRSARHHGAGSHHQMSDLIVTLGTLAFFAAALAFATWLDRLDSKEAP